MQKDTGSSELSCFDKHTKMCRTAKEIIKPEIVSIPSNSKLPNWLTGSYYRIGPGKFDLIDEDGEESTVEHWIDGYALLTKFTIEPSSDKLSLATKFLTSEAYTKAMKYGKLVVSEFATPAQISEPGKSYLSKFISHIIPQISDNTNHSFFVLNNQRNSCKLYTTCDTTHLYEIDQATLDRKARIDVSNYHGLHSWTSHPLVDPVSGKFYNIGTTIGITGIKYSLVVGKSLENFKSSRVLTTIRSQWTSHSSIIHTFGMSTNYIVLIEQPFCINATKVLASVFKSKNECPLDWLEWKESSSNAFYVIDKSTGKILNKGTDYRSAPFFFSHLINCYEDDERKELVVDIPTFENIDVLEMDQIKRKRSKKVHGDSDHYTSIIQRFRIPLILDKASSIVTIIPQNILSPSLQGLELPKINPSYSGKPYKYFYASGLLSQGPFANTLVKINVEEGTTLCYKGKEGCWIFGEPVFVPNPTANPNDEDDGILIVPMTDTRTSAPDSLFFFNAKDLSLRTRVEFNNDITIPPAIHGVFIPKC